MRRRPDKPSVRVAKHHERRRKGHANRDPARRSRTIAGGEPRKPSGAKGFVGIVGNPPLYIVGGDAGGYTGYLRFRGKRPDPNNPAGARSRRRRK